MNFSSDLCTLGTLTESTLLCSLEQRCRSELSEVSSWLSDPNHRSCLQSYIGSVLLSLGPPEKIRSSHFLPSFASSVLRSLAFTHEDQSILISGCCGIDKKKLFSNLLSEVLTHVEQPDQTLGSSILLANQLLDLLTNSDQDESSGAAVVTSLSIAPAGLVLTAACMSCLLLDTSSVSNYKVYRS